MSKKPTRQKGETEMEETRLSVFRERFDKIPVILWFALVTLAVMTAAKTLRYILGSGVAWQYDVALVSAILSGALFLGIYFGQAWAYWLTFVFMVAGIVIRLGLDQSWKSQVIAFLVDLLVLIPVLICRDYFPRLTVSLGPTAQRWFGEAEDKDKDEERKPRD